MPRLRLFIFFLALLLHIWFGIVVLGNAWALLLNIPNPRPGAVGVERLHISSPLVADAVWQF